MSIGRRFIDWLGPLLGKLYLFLILKTTRIDYIGYEHIARYWDRGEPVILAFWHSRLALLAVLGREFPIYVMISRHRDGELIARVAEAFNKHPIRGSSSRGGGRALQRMIELLRQGNNAAITPDGPRGPRQKCQKGVIALAKETQRPIIPVTYGAKRKKIANSWDRFLLIFPFNHATVVLGEPIDVPAEADEETLEQKRLQLESSMNSITEQADLIYS